MDSCPTPRAAQSWPTAPLREAIRFDTLGGAGGAARNAIRQVRSGERVAMHRGSLALLTLVGLGVGQPPEIPGQEWDAIDRQIFAAAAATTFEIASYGQAYPVHLHDRWCERVSAARERIRRRCPEWWPGADDLMPCISWGAARLCQSDDTPPMRFQRSLGVMVPWLLRRDRALKPLRRVATVSRRSFGRTNPLTTNAGSVSRSAVASVVLA